MNTRYRQGHGGRTRRHADSHRLTGTVSPVRYLNESESMRPNLYLFTGLVLGVAVGTLFGSAVVNAEHAVERGEKDAEVGLLRGIVQDDSVALVDMAEANRYCVARLRTPVHHTARKAQ